MQNSKSELSGKEAETGLIIRIEQKQQNWHLDMVVRNTVGRKLDELLDA